MSRKKTHKEFVDELNNNKISFLDEYRGMDYKLRCRCNDCGHIWLASPRNLKLGTGCPSCAGNKKRTHNEFIHELEKVNGCIIVIDKYVNDKTKLECNCKICKTQWFASPDTLLNGVGCPTCGRQKATLTQTRTHEEFLSLLYEINSDIEIIGKYTKATEKVECMCKKCGHIWQPTADSLLHKHGCPMCCDRLNFERKAEQFFKENNIVYIHQKKFDGLVGIGGKPLSYDYYLPTKGVLLEIQGEQHYRPIEWFGGQAQFEKQQEHDKRKRDYAKSNNFTLIEIKYSEEKIMKEILYEKLIS